MDERERARERSTDPLEETSTWPAVPPPAAPPAEAAPVPPVAPPSPTPTSPTAPGSSWSPPPPVGSAWRPGRPDPPRRGDDQGARIVGAILIVVGGWLLLRRYVDLDTELILPIVAIAIGGLLLATGMRPRGRNG